MRVPVGSADRLRNFLSPSPLFGGHLVNENPSILAICPGCPRKKSARTWRSMGTLLIDKLLQTVCTQRASDLHLTVGSPPMLRLHGHMRPLATKVLEPPDTVALMKSITPERCQQELQEVGGTDFGFAFGEMARFRVAVFKQRGQRRPGAPADSERVPDLRAAWLADGHGRFDPAPARLDPRDRADRLGQDDQPGVHDQLDQQQHGPPHHHDRGPDRVFPQAQQEPGQPARDRHRRARLPRGDPPGPADGPGHHPRGRDA